MILSRYCKSLEVNALGLDNATWCLLRSLFEILIYHCPSKAELQSTVFEESTAGVEAGIRVVWVPHPGDDCQLGDMDDGWAKSIPSLEAFEYATYGINVPF